MKSLLIILVLLSQLAFGNDEVIEAREKWSQLEGNWLGTLEGLDLEGDYDTPYVGDILITIEGDNAEIRFKRDDGLYYSYGYEMNMERFHTHAVITAKSANEGWVEVFTFTLLLEEMNTSSVLWNRSVSNFLLKPSSMDARGYFQGFSKLKRLKIP